MLSGGRYLFRRWDGVFSARAPAGWGSGSVSERWGGALSQRPNWWGGLCSSWQHVLFGWVSLSCRNYLLQHRHRVL